MKIAVLNDCYLTQNHLQKLKSIGEVSIYTDTDSEEKAIQRLQDTEIAIISSFIIPITSTLLQSLNNLKYISLTSTGYDNVDISSAILQGIQISNIPDYSTEAVAEHTIALMFAANKKLFMLNKQVKQRPHELCIDNKCDISLLGSNLKDKTIGIVGLGSIGQRVAEIAQGIGMKLIAYNRSPKTINGIEMVSLEELLKRSDVISLHVPLNKQSENMISEKEFNLMKPTAVIINTARGKIINSDDLYVALKNHRIASAALDTLPDWNPSNPLLQLENIIITPHAAWFTKESLTNLADAVVANVEAYAKGSPVNLIT